MKKLFILLVIVGSLGASEFMCEKSIELYTKQNKLVAMALDREDIVKAKIAITMEIYYLEDTIAECDSSYSIDVYKRMRSIAIDVQNKLNSIR